MVSEGEKPPLCGCGRRAGRECGDARHFGECDDDEWREEEERLAAAGPLPDVKFQDLRKSTGISPDVVGVKGHFDGREYGVRYAEGLATGCRWVTTKPGCP